MKKIDKIYSLSCLVLKKTRTHEVTSSAIIPEECFASHLHYAKKRGDICHYECLFITESTSYGHLQKKDYKSTFTTIHGNGAKRTRILVASGIVCDDCGCLESDYRGFDEPIEYVKSFDAISTRQELAAFIRRARKNSITYRSGLCEQCKWQRERIRKEKEREEWLENHKRQKQKDKEEIESWIDNYEKRRKLKTKRTHDASEIKRAEQFFQTMQAMAEITKITK